MGSDFRVDGHLEGILSILGFFDSMKIREEAIFPEDWRELRYSLNEPTALDTVQR